jgi:Papain-like cysteine protease AvrRpt2
MPLKASPLSISIPRLRAQAAPGGGSSQLVPPLPQVAQRAEEWCWAACIQMVLNRLGVNVQQCDVANRVFNQTVCCDTPEAGVCNQPVGPGDIVPAYQKCGHQAQLISHPLSFQDLQSEILGGGRPVEVGMAWTGIGGHVAMVWGAKMGPQGPLLLVNDPKYGSGSVYYVNLLRAYGLGTWQWTWVSIS